MSNLNVVIKVFLISLIIITNNTYCQELKLDWVFHHECEGSAQGQSIVADENYLFCAGQFYGVINIGGSSFNTNGHSDIVLSKYNKNGNMIWVKHYGGKGYDSPLEIYYFEEKIYTIGFFSDTVTFDETELISFGDHDIFICCHDVEGDLIWVKQWGGTGSDQGYAISANAGHLYISGIFQNTVDFGVVTIISQGDYDIFLAKMDTLGNIQWINQAGGTKTDLATSLTYRENNIYVCGNFEDTAVFNDTSLVSAGFQDAYIAKYDEFGNLIWITNIESEWGVSANAINSSDNSLFLTGKFGGTAYLDHDSVTSLGEFDIYIAKYNYNGELEWANSYGSSGMDRSRDVVVDNDVIYNSCYFQFEAEIKDSIVPENTAQLIQLDNSGKVKSVIQNGNYTGEQCVIDQNNSIYTIGTFINSAVFGDTTITAAAVGANIFISKIDYYSPNYINYHNYTYELKAFPNPFHTYTTIEYELTEPSHVQLIIYNAIGETIQVAVDRLMSQGKHSFTWTADRLPEGMYYAVLRSEEGVSVVKMIKQ